MPATRSWVPKVKRSSPLKGSLPMVARKSPPMPASMPFSWLPSDRLVMQASPMQMSAQISSGPP